MIRHSKGPNPKCSNTTSTLYTTAYFANLSCSIPMGRTSKYGAGTMFWVETEITGHKRTACFLGWHAKQDYVSLVYVDWVW